MAKRKPAKTDSCSSTNAGTRDLGKEVDRLFKLVSDCIARVEDQVKKLGPSAAIDAAEKATKIIIRLHEADLISKGGEAKPTVIELRYADDDTDRPV